MNNKYSVVPHFALITSIDEKDERCGIFSEFEGIPLYVGRVEELDESEEPYVYIYGCAVGFENRFYRAILIIDEIEPVMGFESVAEIEEYWCNDLDMLMSVPQKYLTPFDVIDDKNLGRKNK